MKEAVIREKLLEISEALNASAAGPDPKPAAKDNGMYLAEKHSDVGLIVDELRLQIKYLIFDLEASKRENRYLRQMLEMRPPHTRRDNEDGTNW